MQDNLDDLVVFLLRQRNRADAVRLYQDEMHTDSLESKRAVDRIARRNGIPTRHIQHMVWLALMLIAALAYAGAVLAR